MNLFNPHLYIKSTPLFVSVSGGVDSVALLHVAMRRSPDVVIAHYVHDDEYSVEEFDFVSRLAKRLDLPMVIGYQTPSSRAGKSKEEYWRDGRISFLTNLGGPVLTGHTLDDAVEWYLFTCFHGEGHFMPFMSGNLYKPLLLYRKRDIVDYANKNRLQWIEDPSNDDLSRARNRIRHEGVKTALQVNPGLYKTIKQKLYEKYFMKR